MTRFASIFGWLPSIAPARRRASVTHRLCCRSARVRVARFEMLEERALLSGGLPYGASAYDTSEYMIGDVWVTVVLLESNGAIDPSTENWTAAQIGQVKSEIQEGLAWWETAFRAAPTAAPLDDLTFHVDFTYADSPVATRYEPINRKKSEEKLWIGDFLTTVGYFTNPYAYLTDVRTWNNAQRLAHGTDWAYTVFVVNSANDADGYFSEGQDFAWSYLGGPFLVMNYKNDNWGIAKMGQVLAHETGHVFYALDEYSGGNPYTARSGYYNTQNLNAYDGNPAPSSRVPSMMAEATLQNTAYANYSSSPTSLQMIGWRDGDADGVFDVLDVPLHLTGSGAYNAALGRYEFSGSSSAQTLPNLNPRGLGNAITQNKVDAIQYRLDGGAWIDGNAYDDYVVDVSQNVPVSPGSHTIEFRTVVARNGVASNIVSRSFVTPPTLSANIVPENLPAGTVVGTLGTTDPDEGDAFTYTLVSGAGSDDNASFTIVGNQLQTGAAFDYETKGSYTIRVRTTDAGGLFCEEIFTITVADRPEAFAVSADDWTDAGLTLTLGGDGKLHFYHTGTATDAVPPCDPTQVTGVSVVGRGVGDLLIDDYAGNYAWLLIRQAAYAVTAPIDATTVDVQAGQLTAAGIVADTLVIGAGSSVVIAEAVPPDSPALLAATIPTPPPTPVEPTPISDPVTSVVAAAVPLPEVPIPLPEAPILPPLGLTIACVDPSSAVGPAPAAALALALALVGPALLTFAPVPSPIAPVLAEAVPKTTIETAATARAVEPPALDSVVRLLAMERSADDLLAQRHRRALDAVLAEGLAFQADLADPFAATRSAQRKTVPRAIRV